MADKVFYVNNVMARIVDTSLKLKLQVRYNDVLEVTSIREIKSER